MFIKVIDGTPIALHSIKLFYKDDNDDDFVIETNDGSTYSIDEETYNFLSKMVLTDLTTVTSLVDLYARLTKEILPLVRDSMGDVFEHLKAAAVDLKLATSLKTKERN